MKPALDKRLAHIGWALGSSGLIPTRRDVAELFFPGGTEHDAYVKIRDLFRRTQSSVEVIDPYVDSTLFDVISAAIPHTCAVKILTRNLPSDFSRELERFRKQYSRIAIEVRLSADFHDRFIILDGSLCYHLGASIKDAGAKAFMISRFEDSSNASVLILALRGSWENATPI